MRRLANRGRARVDEMKLLRFFSRQKKIIIDRVVWRRVTRCILERLLDCPEYELGIHFIDAAEMATVNETFLNHKGSTDVITFNYQKRFSTGKIHGEIYISVPDAMTYARRFCVPWTHELARYVVHGVLHLRGYDDTEPGLRRVMKREENRLVKELSGRFDLSKLARSCR